MSSRRQEATAFPHIHGTVKSLICQSIKNSYQSFVVCKRLLDVALCDSSRKWEKTIGANGDVYSRPESKKKNTNGYNAPANNKSFESICDALSSIHCVHPYEPSYQIFNGMEQNAFISPFIKITFAYGLYIHHHFDESEDKDLTFKKGAPISHTQTGSC